MASRPNLLLITTDQQRWDATGATGPSFLRTPHFDHLCREGVRFDRAYSDCPMCVPARMTLLTGRHAHRHGLTANGPTRGLAEAAATLPGQLGAAGYQTVAIGKMHFTPQRHRHGFQEMLLPDDYYRELAQRGGPQPMRHGLGQNELHPTQATVPESATLTAWIAERCVDFLTYRRDPEAPFFLWASFSKPHPPLDPPEPYYSMYRDCPIPDPVYGDWCDESCPAAMRHFRERQGYGRLPAEVIRAARVAYYGLVTQVDYGLGRIFAALRASGAWQDTVIVYTSDHGEYLGDHRMGAKGFFHEPSARVPFVLRLPPAEPWVTSNRTVDDLVCLADVCPTFLAAAGVAPAAPVDGLDLGPIARGGAGPAGRRIVSVYADARYCFQLAVTDGSWKYLWFPEGPTEQLFDLRADPAELHNRAGDPALQATKAALREALVAELAASRSPHLVAGALPQGPVVPRPAGFLGAHGLPGYLLSESDKDTRH
ncbi:MAG: sulfatase-like hydrolase/transferase [Gemmataceae bacterium]|nr:sulfatase-like hydrolase/transferase [Gemmataceae bacterium]